MNEPTVHVQASIANGDIMKTKSVPKPTTKQMRPRRWQRPPVTVKQRRNRVTGQRYFEVVNAQPAPRPWVWGRG